MDIKSWSPLDYAQVQSAFQKVSFNHVEMIILFQFLVVLFAVFNIFKVIKKQAIEEKREIDINSFFQLIKEYIWFLVLIGFLPFLIDTIEFVMGYVADAYKKGFGEVTTKTIFEAQKEEVKGALLRKIVNFSFTDFFSSVNPLPDMDTFITLSLKPAIVLIDNWSYSFAIVYRFIYLGALKLTAGIALACYIYEPTRQYFYTWLKNLILCYLLIPGFLFVAVFIDLIREQYILSDTMQLPLLILCLMAKIGGFAMMNKYLAQSL